MTDCTIGPSFDGSMALCYDANAPPRMDAKNASCKKAKAVIARFGWDDSSQIVRIPVAGAVPKFPGKSRRFIYFSRSHNFYIFADNKN